MKLEVSYLFSTSSSGANFFIHYLSASVEIGKTMALSDEKIHTPGHKISDFLQTFIELSGFKNQLALRHRNFSSGSANPEIFYTSP